MRRDANGIVKLLPLASSIEGGFQAHSMIHDNGSAIGDSIASCNSLVIANRTPTPLQRRSLCPLMSWRSSDSELDSVPERSGNGHRRGGSLVSKSLGIEIAKTKQRSRGKPLASRELTREVLDEKGHRELERLPGLERGVLQVLWPELFGSPPNTRLRREPLVLSRT
jgi:hypothetical protein